MLDYVLSAYSIFIICYSSSSTICKERYNSFSLWIIFESILGVFLTLALCILLLTGELRNCPLKSFGSSSDDDSCHSAIYKCGLDITVVVFCGNPNSRECASASWTWMDAAESDIIFAYRKTNELKLYYFKEKYI